VEADNQTYRDLFKNMISGLAHCRVLTDGPPPHDFVYLDVNDAFERLTGLKDAVGRRVTELVPGIRESDPWLLDLYSEVARTGEARRFEQEVGALGQWYSVSVHCPRPGEFVAVFDVTTNSRLASALRESEERYRSIVASMSEGVVLQDQSGAILTCNAAAERILGLTKDQMAGRSSVDPRWRSVHEDGSPFPGEEHPAMVTLRTGAPLSGVVMGVHKPDGALTWISVSSEPLRTAPGAAPHAVVAIFTDITERMLTEEASRLAHQQLSAVLESAGDAVAMVDAAHRLTLFNSSFRAEFSRAYGVKPERGDSLRDLLARHPADLARALGHWERALGGEDFGVAQEFGDPALGVGFYEMRYSPVRDGSGRVTHGVSVTRNVTGRRQVEETLRQSEARFRSLFEGHSAVMLLVDPEGGAIVDANPAATRFYGYDRSALRAMKVSQLNQLSPGEIRKRISEALGRRSGVFSSQHRLADGTLRTVDVNSSPVEVEGRSLLFSVVQDATERERAKEELVRERQRYQTMMAIAQDGIHVLDEAGTLVEANDAFLRLLGYGPEVLGRLHVRDWDVGVPPEEGDAMLQGLLQRPRLFQTQHRRKDGTVFDVEVHAGGILLEGRRHLLASARDITARRESERLLAARHEEIEQLNRSLEARVTQAVRELRTKDQLLLVQNRQAAMGEMIGNIAHQWRQPLTGLGLVLANLKDAAAFGELTLPALEKATADADRLILSMSSTINDFRDFFSPGKAKSSFQALAQLRATLGLLSASFRDTGITVEIDAPQDPRLFGVANEYSQVLMNLLTNARQAIQAARVAEGKVSIRLCERDGFCCLTVRDNGGGVPAQLLERIGEPYFTTKDGGTGLGIYMSRQIIERSMAGRLEISNVAGGAELTVLTPLAPPPGAEAVPPHCP
jgi:PAS domain S-box-containing protein